MAIEPSTQTFIGHQRDRTASCPSSSSSLQIQQDSDLSLGIDVLEAHGVNTSRLSTPIITCHNYTSATYCKQGHLRPYHIAPWPWTDQFLAAFQVPALRRGEIALTTTLPPGVMKYYNSIGLVDPSQVIELNIKSSSDENLGFPYSDPISLARDSGIRFTGTPYGVFTFPTRWVTEQMTQMGVNVVQKSDPFFTNNKADFRTNAEKYGYKTLDGIVLSSADDIKEAIKKFKSRAVWVKAAHLAGGDGNCFIESLDESNLRSTLDKFRSIINDSFSRSNFGYDSIERCWPRSSKLPHGTSIIIEEDVYQYGAAINASSLGILSKSGNVKFLGCSKQITDRSTGAYQGTSPWHEVNKTIETQVLDQLTKIGAYLLKEHNYLGIFGVDFFVLNPEKDPQVFSYEVNARPPSSAHAMTISGKLKAPFYINTDLKVSSNGGTLNSFSDFEAVVNVKDKAFLSLNSTSGILPTAFKSVWRREGGKHTLIRAANSVKVLIWSRESQEECERIQQSFNQS